MNSKIQSAGFRRNFNILKYYFDLNFVHYFVQTFGTIIDTEIRPEFIFVFENPERSAGHVDSTYR